jgi:hypothetical protein
VASFNHQGRCHRRLSPPFTPWVTTSKISVPGAPS